MFLHIDVVTDEITGISMILLYYTVAERNSGASLIERRNRATLSFGAGSDII